MTFKEKLDAKLKELEALNVKLQEGDMEAAAKSAEVRAEIDKLNEAIKAAQDVEEKLKALGTSKVGKSGEAKVSEKAARSLGENFVNNLKSAKLGERFDYVAPEFKTATNTLLEGNIGEFPVGSTTVDTRVVEAARVALQVRDLFDNQTIGTAAYSFFVEGALGTGFSSVNEGAEKTAITYEDADAVIVPLVKIAGYIKESDEYIADYPFLASAVNGRLIYDLNHAIQVSLLTSVLGNSGIQADTTSWVAATTATGLADLILDAMMDVQAVSGRAADAVVMNPADWYTLRIGKTQGGEYYGGGYYAEGRIATIWGLPCVVTADIAAGTILVGAFRTGGTVLSKGGTSVTMSNSNEDDFIKNLVTIRAEERIGLALRVPSAFKKLVKAS